MANGLAKILRPKMFYGPIKPAFMHTLLFIHMYIYATLAAFLSKKISAQIWFIWAVCILCKYCNVKKVQISQLLLYLMCFPFLVFSLKDTWNLFLSLSFSLSLSLSLLYSYLSISLYISKTICMHKNDLVDILLMHVTHSIPSQFLFLHLFQGCQQKNNLSWNFKWQFADFQFTWICKIEFFSQNFITTKHQNYEEYDSIFSFPSLNSVFLPSWNVTSLNHGQNSDLLTGYASKRRRR